MTTIKPRSIITGGSARDIVFKYIYRTIKDSEDSYANNIINAMTGHQGKHIPIPKIRISDKHTMWINMIMRGNVLKLELVSNDKHLFMDDDRTFMIIDPSRELLPAFAEYIHTVIDRMSERVIISITHYIRDMVSRLSGVLHTIIKLNYNNGYTKNGYKLNPDEVEFTTITLEEIGMSTEDMLGFKDSIIEATKKDISDDVANKWVTLGDVLDTLKEYYID